MGDVDAPEAPVARSSQDAFRTQVEMNVPPVTHGTATCARCRGRLGAGTFCCRSCKRILCAAHLAVDDCCDDCYLERKDRGQMPRMGSGFFPAGVGEPPPPAAPPTTTRRPPMPATVLMPSPLAGMPGMPGLPVMPGMPPLPSGPHSPTVLMPTPGIPGENMPRATPPRGMPPAAPPAKAPGIDNKRVQRSMSETSNEIPVGDALEEPTRPPRPSGFSTVELPASDLPPMPPRPAYSPPGAPLPPRHPAATVNFEPPQMPTIAEIEAMDMMPLLDTEQDESSGSRRALPEDDLARPAPGTSTADMPGLSGLSFECPHCDAPLPPSARACPRCRKAV